MNGTFLGVDLLSLSDEIVVVGVVVQVACKCSGTALAVDPRGLSPVRVRSFWRGDLVHRGADALTIHSRMEICVGVASIANRLVHVFFSARVLTWRLTTRDRRVDSDSCSELVRMIERNVRRQISTDGTAHVDWFFRFGCL